MLQCGLISFQLPLFQSVNELISYTLRIFHFSISIGRYECEHNAPQVKNKSNVKQLYLSHSVWKVLEDCVIWKKKLCFHITTSVYCNCLLRGCSPIYSLISSRNATATIFTTLVKFYVHVVFNLKHSFLSSDTRPNVARYSRWPLCVCFWILNTVKNSCS